ncbi:MAG: phospholipase D-like domain-containing protein, partial [Bacteroidota bacterium]
SSASTGEIRVYFNYPVDTALPFTEQAQGNVDLGARILEKISAATRSIDLALYSFDDFNASATDIAQRLADSLVAAKVRGVKVRMVFHDRASTGALTTLINGGIPVLKRTVPSAGSGMHNKFWVFDGRDTVGATDDWVVTGSWNATDDGTYRDAQNAVFIQDRSLAAIYTKEFEEMFGSATDVANSGLARFGPTKRDDTPHWTMVGGTKVEVYFSPSDRTSAAITRTLNSAQQNIFFGLFSFTRDEIAAEIIARKGAGVIARGIIDNINDSGSEYPVLQAAGVDVVAAGHGVVVGAFHHKYGVVDPFHDASDPIVVTGSHNWSSAADTDNDENTVIIHSGAVARQFVREFSNRYSESGGTGSITSLTEGREVPEVPALDAPYPNPFNPSTTVRFALPHDARVRLRVVDVLGRTVETILEETRPAGVYTVIWNADRLATGTYLLVFDADGARLTRKIVLLK